MSDFKPATSCPECGVEDSITWRREEQTFKYASKPTIELTAVVEMGSCAVCKFEFTDWRAEIARDDAIRAHIAKKLRGES